AEPWENHRDAASNRLLGSETAELAGKEQWRLPFLAKVRHVRSVQINLRRTPLANGLDFWQIPVALQQHDPARDFKALQPLRYDGIDHTVFAEWQPTKSQQKQPLFSSLTGKEKAFSFETWTQIRISIRPLCQPFGTQGQPCG